MKNTDHVKYKESTCVTFDSQLLITSALDTHRHTT